MDLTPRLSRFDEFYKNQTPPWVIGEPQQAIVELEQAGLIGGRVLDVGCGTGEHTILLARAGYDVLGIDGAPTAVEQARRNAEAQGVDARFELADALHLGPDPTYDTIVDSALFHIFDDADRATYVRSLHAATRPGSVVHLLALSDSGRGFGPEVSEHTIRAAFGAGWEVEALTETTYRGVVIDAHTEALNLPAGTVVDEPAWSARIRRL
ncbi:MULTISPECIES: class I SAM-dependent methyltransferase [Mycolicibacterium]|jgi:SAM-dependent methyltransferase|uniref:Methyltransferase type 11 n=1 Tax=Mycolicibacterium vanbaalenii (strain DSM 7251 / JCM 13017 / BCRC 16820 / KCTC 9966 / NRRL B-24157 / PYR-1) TaxID=350058 RepID=A1T6A9_MYCVP|nr:MULTISPECIES: class I SAM-dependent methyltransferase [Mycolicibacterium]ABM12709.1 Methyltransferase type 11 [Mycolicibacterium vanbaalenii PYR-1]MCV7130231.1 class I SAM-dependent methyltransferase [Mycolicibacterium vanbaalenii PYR-1]MDW5613985.1 class I SAM-dependent methyltransferase [Mycolicibacterium sp. D5.8-2]